MIMILNKNKNKKKLKMNLSPQIQYHFHPQIPKTFPKLPMKIRPKPMEEVSVQERLLANIELWTKA